MRAAIPSITYKYQSADIFANMLDEIDVIWFLDRPLQDQGHHEIQNIQYFKHRQICEGVGWD